MLPLDNLFYEFAALLVVAAAIGGLAVLLRQPLIVAFIAVGIIAGPTWLEIIEDEEIWELLAAAGIALLLFVVGLKLDLDVIRRTGPVALATGLGQVAFTSGFGFAICLMLGLSAVEAFYVAIALTFSSTIIIVKLLSDKREIDSLHGRIAVGFLIVQDIVVVIVMIGLSAFGAGEGVDDPAGEALLVVAKGIALLAGFAFLMRFVIPTVFGRFARSPELLVLGAIAWAVAAAAVTDSLGFSKEVGAFLAGVSLASTPFRESISSRLVSLRDFLLLFFFLTMGAHLQVSELGARVPSAVVLSLFVLIGNPLIVMVIMGVLGYRRRTGFLAGLTVAQISEFSLILAALGVALGHIDSETLGLITLVGLITIGTSTYLILYSHPLYDRLGPWLKPFERERATREQAGAHPGEKANVILFGLGRYGSGIARAMMDRGVTIMGVDFDPQVVDAWSADGIPVRYGDAEDPEFPAHLPLEDAQWIVSTIPLLEANAILLRSLGHRGYNGKVAATAHTENDADRLRVMGADLVLMPFNDAALEAAEVLAQQIAGPG